MKAKIKLTALSMLAALTTFGAPASRGKPTMAENEHQLPELYGVLFEKTDSRNDKAVGVCRVPLNGNDEPEVLINGMDKCVGDGLRYSGVYLDGTYYFTYWVD